MYQFNIQIATLLIYLSVSVASAQVTFELVDVPIPVGTDIVDGFIIFPVNTAGAVLGDLDDYVCQDLIVDTAVDWTAAAILIELTAGSIYQETKGSVEVPEGFKFYNGQTSKPPSAAFFSVLPSSEYDTYVHGNGDSVTVQGAGGDVGGDTIQFDDAEIDVTWTSATSSTNDIGENSIGRFTFSNNATGTFKLKVTQADDHNGYEVTGTISSGVMSFDP